ncbi:hypothetical protein D3C73_984600 [compost metagenome]
MRKLAGSLLPALGVPHVRALCAPITPLRAPPGAPSGAPSGASPCALSRAQLRTPPHPSLESAGGGRGRQRRLLRRGGGLAHHGSVHARRLPLGQRSVGLGAGLDGLGCGPVRTALGLADRPLGRPPGTVDRPGRDRCGAGLDERLCLAGWRHRAQPVAVGGGPGAGRCAGRQCQRGQRPGGDGLV